MSEDPWLTIVGLGEDARDGLCTASQSALEAAEIVMGPPRHLELLPGLSARTIEWPVPFADGIEQLLSCRGSPTVALVSGDPFWFGAGTILARQLSRKEWIALPGRSSFSLAASRMGWALEQSRCHGLHAAPLSRLRPDLAPGRKMIVLLRDGEAVHDLADYLTSQGFGASDLSVLEALGGPRERITAMRADATPDATFAHPVCVAVCVQGDGNVLPLTSGRDDNWFDHDGQITKRPVRALTLSALAPRPFEHLWDIGGGSGSIAIEWLLGDPSLTATTIERHADRAKRILDNARRLGVDRLQVVTGSAPDALSSLAAPDAVFVGGGLSQELLDWLVAHLDTGTRLVVNAVTLETEALLIAAQARLGGDLHKIDISSATPIGRKQGWKAAYPVVQWTCVL